MIKLEFAHIEEFRGIRKLDIDFQSDTFAISGPNGSGKSGVVDAIEFGLTGQISRLTGQGTKGLSIASHGPHVDKADSPDSAFVELRVFLPLLGKSVTITRKVSAPTKPAVVPADKDVMAALAEVAKHPEITLSRREILRFILAEPAKRSEEIQTILKLDELGQVRAALNTAQNKLRNQQRTTEAQVKSNQNALLLQLQLETLRPEELLQVVNERRKLLGLPEIAELTPDTRLDDGLSAAVVGPDFNKETALRDLNALKEAAEGFPALLKVEVDGILVELARLESDPDLLIALRRREFVERGIELVEGSMCPLCDTDWDDEQRLREYLRTKLVKSAEAQEIQERLRHTGGVLIQEVIHIEGLLRPVQKIAERQGERAVAQMLTSWLSDLGELKGCLTTVDNLTRLKTRLTTGWLATPKPFPKALSDLVDQVTAIPDQTKAIDAHTFLTTAQVRLKDFSDASRQYEEATRAYVTANEAYDTYCAVLEDELNTLYDEVEKDFSAYYRAINEDDESKFTAKLTPSEGKLDLSVNFYERGLFPPAAYHSEGHQDGMGVCLYLALMKRLFGGRFTFALFDDVVMSVDADHRYQFCKLLKTHFPETQFILTTHDRLWAEQLRSAGLVTRKRSLIFHGWTVETGPMVQSGDDVWDEIETAVAKGRIDSAAAALRRHLEFVSRCLADQLAATVPFRADGNHELGDLLPSVLGRMKDLLGKAASVAQSWGHSDAKEEASSRKANLAASNGAVNIEQWAINKAVHYNEWANFGRSDFEPVVTAYKELLGCFRCVECACWLYVTPRTNATSLRCNCGTTNFNLKPKVEMSEMCR